MSFMNDWLERMIGVGMELPENPIKKAFREKLGEPLPNNSIFGIKYNRMPDEKINEKMTQAKAAKPPIPG